VAALPQMPQAMPEIFGGHYFRCRLCYRLRYASQSERSDQRALDQADKIAKRLHDKWSGATEDEYDFPPKPPRMRWATYNRLEAGVRRSAEPVGIGTMRRFARFR